MPFCSWGNSGTEKPGKFLELHGSVGHHKNKLGFLEDCSCSLTPVLSLTFQSLRAPTQVHYKQLETPLPWKRPWRGLFARSTVSSALGASPELMQGHSPDLGWEITGSSVQTIADHSDAVSHHVSLRLEMKLSIRALELVLPEPGLALGLMRGC